MTSTSYDEYLASCIIIARDAGKLLMNYFTGDFSTRRKADNSPVTEADIAANQLIVKALSELTPHIRAIAEEDECFSSPSPVRGEGWGGGKSVVAADLIAPSLSLPPTGGGDCFWLVDPLDGTRSFVRGEPEFTVNIGLVKNKKPVLGVIYAPPQDEMYWGEIGKGAWRQVGTGGKEKIKTRSPSPDGVVVVRSKSHPSKATEEYLNTLRIKETVSGSSSIKFCRIAEGGADIYPRFGRTMEWDTAAGHAILQAAGGRVETTDGKPLAYGKPGFENPAFIAYGK